MASLIILYWRDIPSQVIVKAGRSSAKRELSERFIRAIDAAAMDWIGNGDHDNGAGREYPWWLTQKWTSAYTVTNHFTPMFTYERSVS